jgi:hypothetical protein
VEKIKDAIIRELNRKEPSIALPTFVLSMSTITTNFAANVLKVSVPEVAMKRKPVNETTLIDVMSGYDALRHFKVYGNVGAFLWWFLEQEIPDDEERMWFDIVFVGTKWNEWIKEGREHGKKET